MGAGELLDEIRALYVAQLARAVAIASEDPRARVIVEPALSDELGVPVGEGVLGLPVRIDVVTFGADGSMVQTRVDSGSIVRFDAFSFDWSDGLRVTVHPFQWDCLTARLADATGIGDWKPLAEWFREWFRDREQEQGDGRLLRVVHFLSDPKLELAGSSVRFTRPSRACSTRLPPSVCGRSR